MNEKKYQILKSEKRTIKDPDAPRWFPDQPVTLYRIVALKQFTTHTGVIVKEGEIGGYIQSEDNLSQDDTSWLFHMSYVFGKAKLFNSCTFDQSAVYGNAELHNSVTKSRTRVYGSAKVKNCELRGIADICGNAYVENCSISNGSRVDGNAEVYRTEIEAGSHISDNAKVYDCRLYNCSRVYGNSVLNNVIMKDNALLRDAILENQTVTRRIELSMQLPPVDDCTL